MKRISHKMILGMLLLTSMAVAMLWFYQGAFLESKYMDIKLNSIEEAVKEVGEAYKTGSLEELQNITEGILYTQNISIGIISLDGEILFMSGAIRGRGHGVNGKMPISRNHLMEIIKNGEVSYITQLSRLNTEVLVYAMTTGDGSSITVGSSPLEAVEETIGILRTQLIYTMGILIILSMIIGTFISKVFLNPIQRLNESVKALASGNMNARVEVTSQDEIGTLAMNFNTMADELSKIDKLRKDITANVSHELRTPLGIIRGYAEMVKDISGNNKEKRDKDLDVIIEETNRLSNVVDDILDMSQIQSGYMNLNKETFDIIELAQSILGKYEVTAKNNEINLTLDKSLQECLVYANSKRMEQVFHNLISNALNHTPKGGKVKIKLYEGNSILRIEVQDSGHGIAKEELEYIWDRYYKSQNNGNTLIRGTGLGLSIVKGILEAHNLSYGVTSELGKGSTFYFEMSKES